MAVKDAQCGALRDRLGQALAVVAPTEPAVVRESALQRTDLLPFARKVESILTCKRPKLRYFVGRNDQGMENQLRRRLPDGWIEASIKNLRAR